MTTSPRRIRLQVAAAPILMVVAALSPLLLMLPVIALPGAKHWFNDPSNLWWATAFMVLLAGMPTVTALLGVRWLTHRCEGRSLRDAGLVWTRRSLELGLLGVLVSAIVVAPTALLLAGTARPFEPDSRPLAVAVVIGLANAFLLQGFPEELVMRGYLMQVLRDRPVTALLTSTGLFGVLHLVSNGGQQNVWERVLYLATPTGFAFCAGALVLACRSLWPAVGIHAGFHVTNLALLVAGRPSESPTIWVVTGLVYVAFGLVALLIWRRRPKSDKGVVDGSVAEVVLDR